MKFVSTREVRNNPGGFRDTVADDDVVLTVNGKPFALVVGIDDEDLEEALDLLRRLRAQRAVSRMQRTAAAGGLDALSADEIEAEIREARANRRRGG